MAWLCCLHQAVLGAPPLYEPTKWNRSCNLTATVPAAVFFNRSLDDEALFPMSPGYRIPVPEGDREHLSTVQVSCFGPGHHVNQTLVGSGASGWLCLPLRSTANSSSPATPSELLAGLKMPCGYAVRPSGVVDYWEETVCERSLRSNCYCYALNAKTNSGYCIPGYHTVGDLSVDFASQAEGGPCADAMRKVGHSTPAAGSCTPGWGVPAAACAEHVLDATPTSCRSNLTVAGLSHARRCMQRSSPPKATLLPLWCGQTGTSTSSEGMHRAGGRRRGATRL